MTKKTPKPQPPDILDAAKAALKLLDSKGFGPDGAGYPGFPAFVALHAAIAAEEKRRKKVFLTTGRVSKILGVSPATVFRAVEKGEIAASKTPGGHYRISAETLDVYMVTHGYKEAA